MKNVMELFDLKGKVALVTGGNRGIGKGIALALAQAGADIAIQARNEEAAKKAIAEIEKTGVRCKFYQGDISHLENCKNVVDAVEKDFGKIDILVNNAGIVRNVNAEDMSLEDWNAVINVNLNAVFVFSQLVGRIMIKNKGGSIINISSMSAFVVNTPQPQCSYNASKAAVSHLTRSLAVEWAKYNIRVNSIAPGYILTDLLEPGMGSDWARQWIEATPMKRVGQTSELAGIALYLASEASTYTTGSIFTVDGGYSLT